MTKSIKGELGNLELIDLREVLVKEQHRLNALLSQIEATLNRDKSQDKAQSGVKAAALPTARLRPSPLDQMKDVTDATADLRVSNGNLSADRVAKLYGVPLSQLAVWLGRTKQAVNKTPDADSLQEALGYFERVARLRRITKGDAEFRKWLRTPHPEVAGKNPLELMAKGQWSALADFVEHVLTGTPG